MQENTLSCVKLRRSTSAGFIVFLSSSKFFKLIQQAQNYDKQGQSIRQDTCFVYLSTFSVILNVLKIFVYSSNDC